MCIRDRKKYGYPTTLTNNPEYPAINLGINNINELNNAYWVAVNLIEVIEDKKTIKAAPANPLAILSAIITDANKKVSISLIANIANKIFVKAAMIEPISSALSAPKFIANIPPNIPPEIVANNPKNFEKNAISFNV